MLWDDGVGEKTGVGEYIVVEGPEGILGIHKWKFGNKKRRNH